jgi:hypothetical protein
MDVGRENAPVSNTGVGYQSIGVSGLSPLGGSNPPLPISAKPGRFACVSWADGRHSAGVRRVAGGSTRANLGPRLRRAVPPAVPPSVRPEDLSRPDVVRGRRLLPYCAWRSAARRSVSRVAARRAVSPRVRAGLGSDRTGGFSSWPRWRAKLFGSEFTAVRARLTPRRTCVRIFEHHSSVPEYQPKRSTDRAGLEPRGR